MKEAYCPSYRLATHPRGAAAPLRIRGPTSFGFAANERRAATLARLSKPDVGYLTPCPREARPAARSSASPRGRAAVHDRRRGDPARRARRRRPRRRDGRPGQAPARRRARGSPLLPHAGPAARRDAPTGYLLSGSWPRLAVRGRHEPVPLLRVVSVAAAALPPRQGRRDAGRAALPGVLHVDAGVLQPRRAGRARQAPGGVARAPGRGLRTFGDGVDGGARRLPA